MKRFLIFLLASAMLCGLLVLPSAAAVEHQPSSDEVTVVGLVDALPTIIVIILGLCCALTCPVIAIVIIVILIVIIVISSKKKKKAKAQQQAENNNIAEETTAIPTEPQEPQFDDEDKTVNLSDNE